MADAKKIIATTAGMTVATGLALAAGKKLAALKDEESSSNEPRSKGSRGPSARTADKGGSAPVVTYAVKSNGDGWALVSDANRGTESQPDTKRAAVSAAREAAGRTTPSRLVIHRRDGTVQREHSYGAES